MGYIDDGYLRGSLGGLVHRKEKHLDLDLVNGPKVQDKHQFLIDCTARQAQSAIVAMSIEYYGVIADRFILLNHKELHPTAIIGAFAV
ncbi:hypothetical protein [Sphingobacterium faecium]|uniref:hypothetical protein n=1 Tax=Sphingobacterium faecium TaxID=34087 RepID=UPI003209BE33